MKILIINPNSDPEMTEAILNSARSFANGEYAVDCLPTPGAPKFIDTYRDVAEATPGMIKLVQQNEADYDAFIIACHCDPNLDLFKERLNKPVVGIGEASMKIASMLGHRFAVISTAPHSIPNKEALIRKYHLQEMAASVKAPAPEIMNYPEREKYLLTHEGGHRGRHGRSDRLGLRRNGRSR
jgi:allantoin racemase